MLELFVAERLRIDAEEIVYEHRSRSSNDCLRSSVPRPSAGSGNDLGTENIPCKARQRLREDFSREDVADALLFAAACGDSNRSGGEYVGRRSKGPGRRLDE